MYSQQAAVEAVYSTTYVEDYLDAVVDLPDDLQKHLSRLEEYDAELNRHVREIERLMDVLLSLKEKEDEESKSASISISTMLQSLLVRTQELGDLKLGVAQQIQDMLENKTSQLDIDEKNSQIVKPETETAAVEPSEKKRVRRVRQDDFDKASLGPANLDTSYLDQPVPEALIVPSTSSSHHMTLAKPGPSTSAGAERSQEKDRAGWGGHNDRSSGNTTTTGAKSKQQQEKKTSEAEKKKQYKRRKGNSKQTGSSPPRNVQIDPDEPTYCLCDQVSYGDMIGCDNDLCPIEWFHFSCVSLTTKPKGKWFCPKCRGITSRALKPELKVAAISGQKNARARKEKFSIGNIKFVKVEIAVAEVKIEPIQRKTREAPVRYGQGRNASSKPACNPLPLLSKIKSDPDEPNICLCKKPSVGQIISCDNDSCSIKIFHWGCVSLKEKPKGKWYCPLCRGKTRRSLKPELQKPKSKTSTSGQKMLGGGIATVKIEPTEAKIKIEPDENEQGAEFIEASPGVGTPSSLDDPSHRHAHQSEKSIANRIVD